MSKLFITILSLVLLLLSCKQHNEGKITHHILYFEKKREITIPIQEPVNFPLINQIAKINGEKVLITYFLSGDKLYFININNKQVFHTISLLPDNPLRGFEYINKDSIFLFYQNQNIPQNHYLDSNLFVLCDFNGVIKHRYKFYTATSDTIFPDISFSSIKKTGNKIFFFNSYLTAPFGTLTFMKNEDKEYPLAYLNLENDSFYISKKLFYPFIKEGVYYADAAPSYFYTLSGDSLPIVRFYYTSSVFKWDYNHDSIYQYNLKSFLVDTIYPMSKPSYYLDNATPALYLNIIYDSFREYYYSKVVFPSEKYGKTYWSIIVADKNLNYLGEIFMPKFDITTIDYDGNLVNVDLGETPNSLKVTFFNIKKEKGDFNTYIKQAKETLKKASENISNRLCNYAVSNQLKDSLSFALYIKKNGIWQNKKIVVVTLFSDDGCYSCREEVLNFISYNRILFDKYGLKLLISGDKKTIDELINEFNLSGYRYLYLDTLQDLSRFDWGGAKNPCLTVLDSSGTVIQDSVFAPSDIVPGMLHAIAKALKLNIKKQN